MTFTNTGDWGQPCNNGGCNNSLTCSQAVNQNTYQAESICCIGENITFHTDGSLCCSSTKNSKVCATDLCNGVQCEGSCIAGGVCCDDFSFACLGHSCGENGIWAWGPTPPGGFSPESICCTSGVIVDNECCASKEICGGGCLPSGSICCKDQVICDSGQLCCVRPVEGENPMTNGCNPAFGPLGAPFCCGEENCHQCTGCPT